MKNAKYNEIYICLSKEELQALIDWHDYQEACAEAADAPECTANNKTRREALQTVLKAATDAGK